MNPEFKATDCVFTIDGKVMGTLQPLEIKYERETQNGEDLTFYNREISGTLENVQIDTSFLGNMIKTEQRFDIVGTGYKFPRGNKLPKKKRIRNKWIKKYTYKFKYDNCTLV